MFEFLMYPATVEMEYVDVLLYIYIYIYIYVSAVNIYLS